MKPILFACAIGMAAALSAAEMTVSVTSTKGAAVADAAVALIPLESEAPAAPEGTTAEVQQAGQEFFPYVTVVQAGTRITFPNDDNVQHHVYSLSKARRFELPLYSPGRAETLVFETAGQITLGCNIHDWMIAHVVVVPTPWFGKSNEDGQARLVAPPGRYRLEVWHPRLSSPVHREVNLDDSRATAESFMLTLRPERRIRRTPLTKSSGY